MAKSRTRAKIPQLEEAFSGHFGTHHALVCRQIIDYIDFLDHSIAPLTPEIIARLVPFEPAVTILCPIAKESSTTAEVMIAEMGVDISRFLSAQYYRDFHPSPTSYSWRAVTGSFMDASCVGGSDSLKHTPPNNRNASFRRTNLLTIRHVLG
jgi:hypothetical protein